MATKHTPGPWVAHREHPRGDRFEVRAVPAPYAAQGAYVAGEITEADATLIAAAPDLLAALKDLASYEGLSSPDEVDLAASYQKALAAIAKAGATQ